MPPGAGPGQETLVAFLVSTGKRQRAYAARDVANAAALKQAIARRSRARGDGEDVQAWLLNHFYRHVIGNFSAPAPALIAITTAAQAADCFRPATVPAWLAERLRRSDGDPLLWIQPDSEALLALEQRLVEFLGSRQGTSLQGKLMRINAPQALVLWAAEHAAFEAGRAAGWCAHTPAAVREHWRGRDGVFVEFLPGSPHLRSELAYESQHMRHCLGQFADRRNLAGGYGESYAEACAAGRLRLFSYRSSNHLPHVTISAVIEADSRLRVDQIKGKQNRPPVARYRDEILGFLATLDSTDHTPPDALALGVVRVRAGWRLPAQATEEADQLQLVQRQPELIQSLPATTPLLHWLVAARNPELLTGLTLSPALSASLAAVKPA